MISNQTLMNARIAFFRFAGRDISTMNGITKWAHSRMPLFNSHPCSSLCR